VSVSQGKYRDKDAEASFGIPWSLALKR